MGSMRAVVCDRLGDPSVLTVQDIPVPEAGPRDVMPNHWPVSNLPE